MTRQTMASTRADARRAAARIAGDPGDVGTWIGPAAWQVVGVHVALLPNGKVLAYDSVGDNATETYPVQDHTRAMIWDPATGAQTRVDLVAGGANPFNLFCSGLAHLPDGTLFIAGGNKDQQLHGLETTFVFNPQTNTWTRGQNMTHGRWYPTVTGLRNGEMLITDGVDFAPDTPEVRMTNGSIRELSNASIDLPLYPWLDVAPDGRTFYSGPDQTMRKLNTSGAGSWQNYQQRDSLFRDYGGHAVYDIGKILVAGGGNSESGAEVIDMNGAAPTVTPTSSMANGRRQNNLTLLADGTALATGGNSSGTARVDLDNNVYDAELWNPATGQWRTLAADPAPRQYHSTALLLPDGRVLSSGGGICDVCDSIPYLAKNATIFTPPYLYKKDGSGALAARPTISSAPSVIDWATQMKIGTPLASQIRKVGLMRLGAVTHSNNMDQRYVPLSFSAGSATITANAPANANVAPPGVYMLFIVNDAGVPSVAKMVTIPVNNSPPSVALTAPVSGTSFTELADVGLAANASDPDGTVSKVEFFRGDTKIGEDTAAPYSLAWNGIPHGTYGLRALATDNAGRQVMSPTTSITVKTLAVSFKTSPKSVRVSRSGRFTYRFRATRGSKGKARLASTRKVKVGSQKRKLAVASKSFTSPASGTVKLKLKLPAKYLRALKRHTSVQFTVAVTIGAKHFSAKVKLKPPKKR